MRNLFKNLKEFKFKEARSKVYERIDESVSKEFLSYIDEAEATHDESRRIFGLVFNETKKYTTNDKPPQFKDISQSLLESTYELSRRYK